MKKIKSLILFLAAFFLNSVYVFAAGSASLSVSNSTIENGNSVKATVTVKNTAAWNITITSSGVTSGCTQKFVGDSGTGNNTTKTFTVTCKSTSTGIINFVMSGDITSSDGTNTKINGSKSVTVTNPREKSTNNKLKSLSVEGYEISPEFDKDTNEYSVTVPSTVENIKINATKADSYSKLEGAGEKTVEEGNNTFEIIVTSETGVSNVYKLNVVVMDENPIEVTIEGTKYTVVKVSKNLIKPDLFEETTINIDGFDIPAFINEICNYTLVGLKDEAGNISLFIYQDGNYIKYNEFISSRVSIIFLEFDSTPQNYTKTTLTIDEKEVTAYKTDGDSKYLLYGINLETGKKNYYTYDPVEKTLQTFSLSNYEEKLEGNQNTKNLIYLLSIIILFLFIILILFMNKSRKLKKLVNLKKEKV